MQCVVNGATNAIMSPKDLKVAIGIQSENDTPGVDYDFADVTNIVVHRKWMVPTV